MAFVPMYSAPSIWDSKAKSKPAPSGSASNASGQRRGSNAGAAIPSSGTESSSVASSTSRVHSGSLSVPSSRRSSIEHHPTGQTTDLAQIRAVREAVIKRDVEELRRLSVKGFVNNAMRRLVWPLMLNVSASSLTTIKEETDAAKKDQNNAVQIQRDRDDEPDRDAKHKDEYQVKLDIDRSFVHLTSDDERTIRRRQLSQIIVSTLRAHPSLNYFQGYHDIVSVIILVCDDDTELAERLSERVSLYHIRDSMLSWLGPTVGYLRLLKKILEQADPSLAEAVEKASSIPYFSISWVLTLFAHDITSIEVTARVFDFLLAHNPAMVSYLCAAIVIAKKNALSELDPDIANDPATVHTVLSKLPKLSVDLPSRPSSVSTTPNKANSPRPTNVVNPGDAIASAFTALANLLDQPVSSVGMHSRTSSVNSSGFIDLSESADGVHPSHSPRTRKPADQPLYLNDLFAKAVYLYAQFPLDHSGVNASSIFGPQSAVFTWGKTTLSNTEAEQIVAQGTDVIMPDPEEEEKRRQDSEEKRKKDEQSRKLLRKAGKVPLHRLLYALQQVGISQSTAVLILAGMAGIMLATYATKDGSVLYTNTKIWLRQSWIFSLLRNKLNQAIRQRQSKQEAENRLASVLAESGVALMSDDRTDADLETGDSSPSVYSIESRVITPEPPWM